MNRNKLLLVFIVNLILFFIVYSAIEYFVYTSECSVYKKKNSEASLKIYPMPKFSLINPMDNTSIDYFKTEELLQGSRKPVGLEFDKKPVVLFGCSYTYGENLKSNEIFSYKLSKYAKLPVYNYGFNAFGIQHMMYILGLKDFKKHIKSEPAYVVYTFIPDHIRRLYLKVYGERNFGPYLRYYLDGEGNLQEYPRFYAPLSYSYIGKKILMNSKDLKMCDVQNGNNDDFIFMKKHFERSKNQLEKMYPNTKFVILVYEDDNWYPNSWYLNTKRWDELEKEGFIVIKTSELVGRRFNKPEDFTYDSFHPSAKAWDLIVPKLAKRLDL